MNDEVYDFKELNDTEQLLQLLSKALSYKFSSDPTKPGIVVSFLGDSYYVSLVRYEKAFAKDKKVVFRQKSVDLNTGLRAAASYLAKQLQERSPMDDLRDYVSNPSKRARVNSEDEYCVGYNPDDYEDDNDIPF